jgi:S-adenosylmethionine-diacylglycerol 3-amino-3-carboxypropyl transferase
MNDRCLCYGQCWEDAACLLAALAPRPGSLVLSIASGGENSLALLTCPGVRVLALDRSGPQIAALELKVAAFRHLDHGEMLQLLGAWPAERRLRQRLYDRCHPALSAAAAAFWDQDPGWLSWGVLPVARFERYLGLFRRLVLPLVRGPGSSRLLLQERDPAERRRWYGQHWDGWRWRGLVRLFFNRTLLGHLGTDPRFVRFGEGSQAEMVLAEVRRVMVSGDPSRNPYLHWILRGCYGTCLPLALRQECFATIRAGLDRLRWRPISLEDWLESGGDGLIGGFNLSNVLEYVEASEAARLLDGLHRRAAPGARLVLWNRLAERGPHRGGAGGWRCLDGEAAELARSNQVPFYRRLVVAQSEGVPIGGRQGGA